MSLVSEALKKAEREAAAREARAKGLPAPLETPLQPYRAARGQRGGRSARALFAGLGAAAAIVLVAFLARPAFERKAANKGATVATPAPAPEMPPSATSAVAPAAAPPFVLAPSASEPAPVPKPTLPSPEATSRTPPAVPSEGEPSTTSVRAREHVRRVDFPDGSKLELGGIAFSDTAPFAYLNGKLLAVGEGTAGYRLVRIERDRVVVRGEAGDLTIRLKAP